MSRLKRWGTGAFLCAAVMSSVGMTARHLHLTKSLPADGATLTEAPDSIQLWFSEPVERTLSAIRVEGPTGGVDLGELRGTGDPASIAVDIELILDPGPYRVNWRAVGGDGHPVRGDYSFVVGGGSQTSR